MLVSLFFSFGQHLLNTGACFYRAHYYLESARYFDLFFSWKDFVYNSKYIDEIYHIIYEQREKVFYINSNLKPHEVAMPLFEALHSEEDVENDTSLKIIRHFWTQYQGTSFRILFYGLEFTDAKYILQLEYRFSFIVLCALGIPMIYLHFHSFFPLLFPLSFQVFYNRLFTIHAYFILSSFNPLLIYLYNNVYIHILNDASSRYVFDF